MLMSCSTNILSFIFIMQMRIIFLRIKTTTKLDWDGPCKVPFRLYLTTQITTTAKHRDFFRFKPKKSTFFKGGWM